MRSKKKAPTDAATSAGATMETGQTSKTASSSNLQSNTAVGYRQKISDFLSYGPENGVTLPYLEKMTGLDNRTVRRQIERERRSGALIISNNRNGYYLTDDPAEAQRFARSMQHRAREILRTARAIEGAAGLD